MNRGRGPRRRRRSWSASAPDFDRSGAAAVGRTPHAPAVPEGDPQASFGIDRHAVGIAFAVLYGRIRGGRRCRPRRGVSVVTCAVVVVHDPPVRAEGRAVGHPIAAVNSCPVEVRVKPVQGARSLALVVVHGAGQKRPWRSTLPSLKRLAADLHQDYQAGQSGRHRDRPARNPGRCRRQTRPAAAPATRPADRRVPAADVTVRVAAEDFPALDVDPVQRSSRSTQTGPSPRMARTSATQVTCGWPGMAMVDRSGCARK